MSVHKFESHQIQKDINVAFENVKFIDQRSQKLFLFVISFSCFLFLFFPLFDSFHLFFVCVYFSFRLTGERQRNAEVGGARFGDWRICSRRTTAGRVGKVR